MITIAFDARGPNSRSSVPLNPKHFRTYSRYYVSPQMPRLRRLRFDSGIITYKPQTAQGAGNVQVDPRGL